MKLVPFKFDGTKVRAISIDDEPWFVLADACKALGLSADKGSYAAHADKLDDDEKRLIARDLILDATPVLKPGVAADMISLFGATPVSGDDPLLGDRTPMAWVVSEAGLYTLILRCRDAVTPGTVPHRFRKWVTAEVLPSIRKTGAYGQTQPDYAAILNDPAALRGLLGNYAERVIRLEGQVEEMRPAVSALNRIAISDGSLCITDAAKTLQVQPQDLFRHLRVNGWIYRRAGGASDIAYQSKIISGLLEHKTTTVHRTDGSEKTASQVRITPKGLARLAEELTPKLAL